LGLSSSRILVALNIVGGQLETLAGSMAVDSLDILLDVLDILAIRISQTTFQPHPHLIHNLFHLAPDLVENSFLLLPSCLYLTLGQNRPVCLVHSWICLAGGTADRQQLVWPGIPQIEAFAVVT
jgi:hypothetical protein